MDRKICRCRNVYASQIIKEIKAGADKLDIIEEKTGAMSYCGGCTTHVEILITENRKK